MSERPPFDPVRAAFWLVAGVLALHALSIVATMTQCVLQETAPCDVHDSLRDLFAEVMAVALAFVARASFGPPDRKE